MPRNEYTAIEIDNPTAWEILCALEPHFNELSYEENIGNFVVFNFGEERWSIFSPNAAEQPFERIELSMSYVKLARMIGKE
jgi:hypothetical protein